MPKKKCPECGMDRSQWTRNDGLGFEKEGLTYCCKGCARTTGCVCKNDVRPRPKNTRKKMGPHSLAGHDLSGREATPTVND